MFRKKVNVRVKLLESILKELDSKGIEKESMIYSSVKNLVDTAKEKEKNYRVGGYDVIKDKTFLKIETLKGDFGISLDCGIVIDNFIENYTDPQSEEENSVLFSYIKLFNILALQDPLFMANYIQFYQNYFDKLDKEEDDTKILEQLKEEYEINKKVEENE